jgi:Domain of unknown function (DUF4184)
LPWIVPSHQAPALWLKSWRPRWFSGLGLVLGGLAPDLEFIVPVRKEMFLSHTLPGQVLFTLPVALVLYLLSTDLVLPWLSPYLPPAWRDLDAIRRPTGRGWLKVAASAVVGGLTHVALDGVTHDAAGGGWAVAFLPWLAARVSTPMGALPLHDVLQIVLTVVLGAASLLAWRRILRKRLLWKWRERTPPAHASTRGRSPLRLACCVLGCGILGAGAMAASAADGPPGTVVELASYALLDGLALGLLLGACGSRIMATSRRPVPAPREPALS